MTYEIHQSSPDDPYGGIRITDIDIADFARDREPGYYHVQRQNNKWSSNDKPSSAISTNKVAINGKVESHRGTVEKLIPEMIEKAYGDIDTQGFDFFYQPKPLLHRGLRFKTPTQKQTNIFVASDRLARGLLQAQNRGQTVQ